MTQLLTPPPQAEVEEFESFADDAEDSAEEVVDVERLDAVDQRLNDEHWLEYVDGEFLEKNVSDQSSLVGGVVVGRLNIAADFGRLARVYSEGLIYRCWPDEPKRSRRPDASVVRLDRWSAFVAESRRRDPGELTIAPDLAVEVVSPNDAAEAVAAKIEEYRAAGFPLTWVVYPHARLVDVYAGDAIRRLREGDELTLPDLLPAFRHRVGDLLGPPTPA